MSAYHFSCPSCTKLMSLQPVQFGKKVRCPHCREVVRVPQEISATERPNPADDSDDLFQPQEKPRESHDSIFGETIDEDLFGSQPIKPILPPEESKPTEPPKSSPTRQVQPLQPTQSEDHAPFFLDQTEPVSALETSRQRNGESRQASRINRTRSSPWLWIVSIWAIVATAGAIYFALTPTFRHPFEAIPDVYGEYERADRAKISRRLLPDENEVVPGNQRVALNQTLRVHDLEIKPTHVELSRPDLVQKRRGKEADHRPAPGAMFVLHLQLTNRSKELAFFPTDPAFNRKKLTENPTPVYNRLKLGSQIYPGGLFPWPISDLQTEYELIQGQESDRNPLKPGETRNYLIPSTIAPRMREMLEQSKNGKGFWQIQLRTGAIEIGSGSSARSIAVSSVIGVEFNASQIEILEN